VDQWRKFKSSLTLLCLLQCAYFFQLSAAAEEEFLSEAPNLTKIYIFGARRGPTMGRLSENVEVFNEEDFSKTSARTVDEFMQRMPEFSLFRRASSMVAHPTTQGAALRGVKPSGTSRVLVLLDGVPLNDPFGGWILWQRLPLYEIERIELYRGTSAHVWGNYALSGAINIISRQPVADVRSVGIEIGSYKTYSANLYLSETVGDLGVSFSGDIIDSAGYHVLRSSQRGGIDQRADLQAYNLKGKAEYSLNNSSRLFLTLGHFSEDRGGGTRLTGSESDGYLAQLGGAWTLADYSVLTTAAFYREENFSSFFSSQATDRGSETPALDQFDVPSDTLGLSADWIKETDVHVFTAGADFQNVTGETNEDFRYMQDEFTRRRRAGGEQRFYGAFLQDVYSVTDSVRLTLGARLDRWENFDSFRHERDLENELQLLGQTFPDRSRNFFNPSGGIAFDLTERLALETSAYRSSRAPNLNELYRPFRVRNDITEANPELSPERLTGGDLALQYFGTDYELSATAFLNRINNPIANVTVDAGPGLTDLCGFVPEGGRCSQRSNLGSAYVRGLNIKGAYSINAAWSVTGAYALHEARIRSASEDPELEGNRLAQVPKHSILASLHYTDPDLIDLTLTGNFQGRQYEDDRNTLRLSEAVIFDITAERQIKDGVRFYAGIQNLFNTRVEAGKTADGLVTLATPFRVLAGLRVSF